MALASVLVASVAALFGAVVRIMPWLFDPELSLRVLAPFLRSLSTLALEAAILVGWPIGWALAAARLVERGEHRVFAALGESPRTTALRFAPQAALFACALGLVSFVGARDAGAPGRVVMELLDEARVSCAASKGAATFAVPFTNATWLCRPDAAPRLAGFPPGGLSSVFFTASDARISGDLRSVELTDARLLVGTTNVHASSLRLAGLSPFTHGSNVPPLARAFVLGLGGAGAALLSVYLVLARVARRRFVAFATGASGPLAALGLLRLLERSDARAALAAVVPLAAALATLACALALSRLLRVVATASK